MISEEEKQRVIEAVNCESCLDWHHHCNAECCKIIILKIDPKELEKGGKFFIIRPSPLSLGDRKYYQLRDVDCIRGFLRFKKDRIIVVGKKVMYIHPCKLLKENLCEGHPDNKPKLCKLLTLETAQLPGQPFEVTENCLFKYKCKGVKENVKKREN